MATTTPTLSLADFQRNAAEHVTRLKATGEPEVLTVDGRPEVVVQSAAAYQALVDEAELAHSLDVIRRGQADVAAGRVRPALEALDELAARYGIDLRK